MKGFYINLDCRLDRKRHIENNILILDFFKELIDYSVKKGTRAIKLNYINEPLIRKDIIQYIEYAKKSGVLDIYLSTNGSLLKGSIVEKLIFSVFCTF